MLCYRCKEFSGQPSLKLRLCTACPVGIGGAHAQEFSDCTRLLSVGLPWMQVTFLHVMHLLDHDRAAQAAYRHLRPGGLLLVAFNDRWAACNGDNLWLAKTGSSTFIFT